MLIGLLSNHTFYGIFFHTYCHYNLTPQIDRFKHTHYIFEHIKSHCSTKRKLQKNLYIRLVGCCRRFSKAIEPIYWLGKLNGLFLSLSFSPLLLFDNHTYKLAGQSTLATHSQSYNVINYPCLHLFSGYIGLIIFCKGRISLK